VAFQRLARLIVLLFVWKSPIRLTGSLRHKAEQQGGNDAELFRDGPPTAEEQCNTI